MPLDPNDQYYIAEIIPASIDALRSPLCTAYGVGPTAFGAKGNTLHRSGYHRSRQWILNSPDSSWGADDYSVRQTLDKSGDQRWVSAFDLTPGEWGTAENRRRMKELTGRVYAAAKARDPRLADLREFAGTLDGSTVVTFNCADGSFKSPFDQSHLDHIHGSFWRSRAANDHTSLLQVLLGKDGDMADITPQDTNAWYGLRRTEALFKDLPTTVETNEPNKLHEHLVAIDKALAGLQAGGVDPAAVAALVVEQLGPLLPTLDDIKALVETVVDAKLNATHLSTS